MRGELLSIHFSFRPQFRCQRNHLHARKRYANVASAFSLAHHYRVVLAWGFYPQVNDSCW